MEQAEVTAADPARFEPLVTRAVMHPFGEALERARTLLAGRRLWHVSSTATGGGVAEMLQSVLGYLVEAGIDTRWLVIDGTEDFFVLTKRIHHMLHDQPGDGGPLGEAEHDLYVSALADDVQAMLGLVQPGDVAIIHDPQPLGLAEPLHEAGVHLVWNCHIGVDEPGGIAQRAWEFLLPHVTRCDAQVFSRECYVWSPLERAGVRIVPPTIDAFSPKNQALEPAAVAAILHETGIVAAGAGRPEFLRLDGSPAKVALPSRMIEDAPLPPGAPLVTQISRWDPLKDHPGVMEAFARHVPASLGAHLVLAGPAPSPDAVADDPEDLAVFDDVVRRREQLPAGARERVHIAALPMEDVEQNAAIVNALQRYSAVIVQKSVAEGFGLTVAEAMWKARPVVASRVGGIQDQVEDGRSGLLVDAKDLEGVGDAVTRLVEDCELAERISAAAHQRVAENYLVPGYLTSYLKLVADIA
jgi:trehalose synthase